MTRPDATIVVPSFGGAERLPVLLDALRRQTFDGVWELVIVLDGVVDTSREVLAAVDDLRINVIEFSENRGRPAALNAGFGEARGRVLIRCDDDLGVAPTFLANHVAAHQGPEPVGLVGLCHDVLPESKYARFYGRPANGRLRAAAYSQDPSGWWKYWAANCSVTKTTFDRVGPYDERFRAYGWEDVDWGYRLHRLGVPVLLEPSLEVLHLAASSNVAVRTVRAYLGGRAHARFDQKHGIAPTRARSPGATAHAWNLLTHSTARLITRDRLGRWADLLDRRERWLPPEAFARSVALLVESAAVAGYRSVAESQLVP